MFEELKNNIEIQIEMVRELSRFIERLEDSSHGEDRVIHDLINSIKKRLKLVNNSTIPLIREIGIGMDKDVKKEDIESLKLKDLSGYISINRKDKDKFLDELRISQDLITKLKKRKPDDLDVEQDYKKPGSYSRAANKLFLDLSKELVKKNSFRKVVNDLKKSNLNILSTSYVSMMILTIVISFIIGIMTYAFFLFFYVSYELPIIHFHSEDFLMRSMKLSWIIIAFPLITGLALYFYPGSEKGSLRKKIDRELPFVVIHMGSISGSGIEPVEIFKIISSSGEYKYTSKEIKKLLNQINLYGYDLVTSLINVARSTPSSKLAEVLNGLATSLNSGGNLEKFFEERAKTLLLEYRLEREKFIKTAETFMDIYISVVIATPMILLLLLVMISVSGVQVGLGINEMTFLIIGIVSVINIIFLVFLHLKQPAY